MNFIFVSLLACVGYACGVQQEPPTVQKIQDLDMTKNVIEKEIKRKLDAEMTKHKEHQRQIESMTDHMAKYVSEFESLQAKGKIDCNLCHDIFGAAWNKANLRKVLVAAVHVCEAGAPSDVDRCRTFVETYGPDAVTYLRFAIHSSDVCDALQMCTEEKLNRPAIKDNSAKCEGCKFGVSILDSMLESTTVQSTLTQLLVDNACDSISDQAGKDECKALVSEYAPAFLNALGDILGSNLLCVDTGACKE